MIAERDVSILWTSRCSSLALHGWGVLTSIHYSTSSVRAEIVTLRTTKKSTATNSYTMVCTLWTTFACVFILFGPHSSLVG